MNPNSASDVEAYIAAVENPQARLWMAEVRGIATSEVPDAAEVISYQMPALRLRRVFFWYAAFKNHCSLFGMPHEDFVDELQGRKTSKGTIQFPMNEPPPEELIRRMLRHVLQTRPDIREKPKKN